MSWPVVLVFGYALIGLELVLPAQLRLGPTTVAPSFILPYVVFIAMFAPPTRAYWTALLLGLTLDLLTPWGGDSIVPGPRALGFVGATFLVITLRSVINRNMVALIVLSVLGSAIAQLLVVAIISFRSLYTTPVGWRPREELVQRLLGSLYTGGSAAVVGLVLFACLGLFRFHDPFSRRRV